MSDYQSEVEYLEKLNKEVEHIKELVGAQKKRIVSAHSPVERGDIVKVNGISHKGKWMKVYTVSFSKQHQWQGGPFKAKGLVLKASGEVGEREAESFYSYGDEPERPDQ